MPQLLDQGDWIEVTGLTPGSWTVVNLDAYSPPANYSGVVLACHRTQLSPDGHDRFGIRAVGDTFNNNESYRYSPTGTTAPHQHFLHGAPDDNGNVEIYAKQLVEFTVYIAGWWLEGEFVGLDNAVNLLPMASTTPVNHQYFEIDLNPLIPVGLVASAAVIRVVNITGSVNRQCYMMSAGATVTDNTPYTFTYRMVEDRIVGLTNNVLKCAMSEVTSFAIHLVGVVASGYVEFGTEQHMMNVSDKNEKTTVINNLPEGAYAVNIGENGLATGLRGYLVPGNTPHNFDEITVIGVSSRLVNLGAANDITWKNSGSSYGYTVYGAFVPVATNDRNVLIIASNNGKYYAKYPAGNGPLR